MKMLACWTIRAGSVTWEYDNPQNANRELFSRWQPPESLTIDALLLRADGEGGYAIIDTDDAGELLKIGASFAPWFEFQILPVIDMLEGMVAIEEAVTWRRSVLGGADS